VLHEERNPSLELLSFVGVKFFPNINLAILTKANYSLVHGTQMLWNRHDRLQLLNVDGDSQKMYILKILRPVIIYCSTCQSLRGAFKVPQKVHFNTPRSMQ